jgi:hypothetical protein
MISPSKLDAKWYIFKLDRITLKMLKNKYEKNKQTKKYNNIRKRLSNYINPSISSFTK